MRGVPVLSVLFCCALLCDDLTAQVPPWINGGAWIKAFDHKANDPTLVDPRSVSLQPGAGRPNANPQRWITTDQWPNPGGLDTFNVVHACLIPSRPHRGEVLVIDGNLRAVGVRVHQPWAIVNPYFPSPNPCVPGGGGGYRFYNATLQMVGPHPAGGPGNGLLQDGNGEGELFCGGQCWLPDGRLFFASGTRRFPPHPLLPNLPVYSTTVAGGWDGAALVYQWDPQPSGTGNPFGVWVPQASLDTFRWYASVKSDDKQIQTVLGPESRVLILGGTHLSSSAMVAVNSYESYRILKAAPIPLATFEQKPSTATSPYRRYAGPMVGVFHGLHDYPRFHSVGVLDPIPGSTNTVPRLFVSGFWAPGFRWVHDPQTDPAFAFDIGQEVPPVDIEVRYGTSLLLPAGPGGISSRVVRIGGERAPAAGPSSPSQVVESTVVTAAAGVTQYWSSGGPTDLPDMANPRFQGNVVILPTGDLFAVGGQSGPNTYCSDAGAAGQRDAMAPHGNAHVAPGLPRVRDSAA